MPAESSTAHAVLADVELTGHVALVTGASAGLGLEVARALAARGATVAMAARDPRRGEAAAATVGPHGQPVTIDLASLAQVRAGAAEILRRWPHIDLLINNAGVMVVPPGHTVDGFDTQLGTNHLGHFLLTALLAPALGPDARIVNVTSRGHAVSGMRWDDPHFDHHPYEKWAAYGQSKTANILFTRGLAARGYSAVAVHPGMIGTDLYRHLGPEELAGVRQATLEAGEKTPAQGAAGILWAATVGGIPSGSYLADFQVAEPAAHATDPDDVERLWTWSEQEVGQPFPTPATPRASRHRS